MVLSAHLEHGLGGVALAIVNEGLVDVQALVHVANRLVWLTGDVSPQPDSILTYFHATMQSLTIEQCRSGLQGTGGPLSRQASSVSPASCPAGCLWAHKQWHAYMVGA